MISEGKNKLNERFLIDYESFSGKIKRPCVFISHHKEDSAACVLVADYLKTAGLHYYFDQEDADLQSVSGNNRDPGRITKRILKGLDESTDVICVMSPKTLTSQWVPFEIGYTYGRKLPTVLTLIGIADHQLPEFLKATGVDIIRGIESMKKYVTDLSSDYQILDEVLERTKTFSDVTDHNLRKILEPGK